MTNKERRRLWRQKNKDRINARAAKYRKAHRKEANARALAWKLAHPRSTKNQQLRIKYGITLKEFIKIRDSQDNKCAICQEKESYRPHGKIAALSVDHCHKTNRVRGLLCNNCNNGLGRFRDNPELLVSAKEYLRRAA